MNLKNNSLILLILYQIILSASGLNCYDCRSDWNGIECRNIFRGQKQFLRECPPGHHCFTYEDASCK